MKQIINLLKFNAALLLVLGVGIAFHASSVHALDSNFANGITVDSTLDTSDANIGDSICDDGDGFCTLRAAIEEANSNSDSSVINFNITGTADYTLSGQNGYRITPQTGLPNLESNVTVNGYTQPGSSENTSIYGQLPNARILIEIDTSSASNSNAVSVYGTNIAVRGLSIYGATYDGIWIADDSDSVTIEGNYLGVKSDGTSAGNGEAGVSHNDGGLVATNIRVGSAQPQDLNYIANNNLGGVNVAAVEDMIVQGNYIVDNPQAVGVKIEGNLANNNQILGNYLKSNAQGIVVSTTTNVRVESNEVIDGDIGINLTGNVQIDIRDNVVHGSATAAIVLFGAPEFGLPMDDIVIQSNILGSDRHGNIVIGNGGGIVVSGNPGHVLIGGSGSGEGNDIIGTKAVGVLIQGVDIQAAGINVYSTNISILGNSISKIVNASVLGITSGIGIDLLTGVDSSTPPDGQADSFTNQAVTFNDSADSDVGPNNFINFPVLNTITQKNDQAIVNFNLDAADSPINQYRVEFFSNDQPNYTGYGEGQNYLGAVTVGNGINQQAALILPPGFNLRGKSISATTTAVNATNLTGFGGTSEFSRALLVGIPSQLSGQVLANTGANVQLLSLIGITATLVTSSIILRRKLRA